ncbi:MAG: hypothetical protein WCS77_07445 [Elusimicrobiaceae bacterium]|jgi:hypothetical protein
MKKYIALAITAVAFTGLVFAAQTVYEAKVNKTWTRIASETADSLNMPRSVTIKNLKLILTNSDPLTKKLGISVEGAPLGGEYTLEAEKRNGKLYGKAVLFSNGKGGGCSAASAAAMTLFVPLNVSSDGQAISIGSDVQLTATAATTWDDCHGEWETVNLIK